MDQRTEVEGGSTVLAAIPSASVAAAVLAIPWVWPFATGPWPMAQQLLVTLACVGIVLLFVAGRGVALVQALALSWLIAALLSAMAGLAQYFGWSAVLQPWVDVTQTGEAFGNLRQRNQFATLTNLGLLVLLWNPLRVREPARGELASELRFRRPLGVLLACLLVSANAASASRTGLVQLGLLVLLSIVWRRGMDRAAWEILVVACLGYIVAALLLPLMVGMNPVDNGIGGRLRDEGLRCGSRWTLWGNVLHLIAQRPWTGWGWGELDYAHFMAAYDGPRFCEILDNAHNLPLHLAVELGVPIAVAACALAAWLCWRARPWREREPARRMAWAVLALILLHSMLEYPLWYAPFQLTTVGAIWLLLRPAHADAYAEVGVPPHWRMLVVSCAVMLLIGVAYAAWDYWRVSQIYLAPDRRDRAYVSNTLQKIQGSWLFSNQVRFAELSTTDLGADNAESVYTLAKDMLHFSPEARVVEKLVASALVLGLRSEAQVYAVRYREAFPKEYARWALLTAPAAASAPGH